MTTTINASTSAGLVQTADTSGNLSLQSGGTTILALTSTGAAVTGALSATTTLSVTGTTTLGASSQGVQINRASDFPNYGLITLNGLDASTTACGMYGRGSGGDSGKLFITGIGTVVSQIAGVTVTSVSSTGLAVTGTLSATNYISVASGADNVGVAGASFGYSATYGTSIVSGTGTNKDFVLWKRGGLAAVMSVSTNSTTVTFGGDVSGGSFQGTNGLFAGASGASTATISQSSVGGGSLTHYIGNQSITTSSDFRLKENIVDTQRDALDILNKLRVVDHTWNDPSDQCENNRNARGVWTGLIAQEAVDHVRWLVNKPLVDEEEDGSKNYWQMDYGYAVPLLIKAIQQLTTRLAALETK